jgi:hypothetical protein
VWLIRESILFLKLLDCKLKLLNLHGERKVALKACGGVEIEHHTFLTTTLNEDEWSASCFAALSSEKTCRYSMDKRVHGPQIWLRGSGDKEKVPDLARNWTPPSFSPYLITWWTMLRWLVALLYTLTHGTQHIWFKHVTAFTSWLSNLTICTASRTALKSYIPVTMPVRVVKLYQWSKHETWGSTLVTTILWYAVFSL